jgi:hypothetical protein
MTSSIATNGHNIRTRLGTDHPYSKQSCNAIAVSVHVHLMIVVEDRLVEQLVEKNIVCTAGKPTWLV